MLCTKFQASKPSGTEVEDFLIFFYVLLRFDPRTPWRWAIFKWDLYLNKLGKGAPGNVTYPISSILAKSFRRRFFY